jgi:hypothetical protein
VFAIRERMIPSALALMLVIPNPRRQCPSLDANDALSWASVVVQGLILVPFVIFSNLHGIFFHLHSAIM